MFNGFVIVFTLYTYLPKETLKKKKQKKIVSIVRATIINNLTLQWHLSTFW